MEKVEEVVGEVVGATEMKVDKVEMEVVKSSNWLFPQFVSSAVIELCKYHCRVGYKYLPWC